MNVGHIMAMLGCVKAEFIGRPVDHSAFDSASGQPCGETLRMMIASRSFRTWCPPKFRPKNDQGLFEQTSLLQVSEQTRQGLIHFSGEFPVIAFDVGVRIPFTTSASTMK